ncbi:hypothetical protein T492DRAFT_1064991 [Pavlovales sp. CCMP2436]|nr:hypothetical protein T492DRAFT_1064991 [Pavlovales sp. CCMP2436]
MLVFLVLALVVAAQRTVGRARPRPDPAAGHACPDGRAGSTCLDGRMVRSLLARVIILAKRARTRRRRAIHDAERSSLFALTPKLVQELSRGVAAAYHRAAELPRDLQKELKSVNPIVQDLLSAVATTCVAFPRSTRSIVQPGSSYIRHFIPLMGYTYVQNLLPTQKNLSAAGRGCGGWPRQRLFYSVQG